MFSARFSTHATVALATMAAVLALATGCGEDSGSSADSAPPTPQATVTVTATPSSGTASASQTRAPLKTATQYANAINNAVRSAAKVTTLTEKTDSNNLLGRPNGYISAAVVTDKAGDTSDTPGVDYGATVEMFATESQAVRRSDYIQGLLKDSPILGTEYNYIHASVLLRVSGKLPPSVAKKYKAAFDAAAS